MSNGGPIDLKGIEALTTNSDPVPHGCTAVIVWVDGNFGQCILRPSLSLALFDRHTESER